MTRLFCSPSPTRANQARKNGYIPVLLYGVATEKLAGVGHPIVEQCRLLSRAPSPTAWDLLSFALGVTAADSFVKRSDAANGWTREMDLTVEVIDPAPWVKLGPDLEATLRFLTGDIWKVHFQEKGSPVPGLKYQRYKDGGCDAVCLFSGGLDSFIGVLDISADKRVPYLVSCAYPKDSEKQRALVGRLGIPKFRHFAANPDPRWAHENETSMRSRSLLFLALGALIASTIRQKAKEPVDLFLPENGFISLNVPLTSRRLGSLSTRTTHPHFIDGVRELFHRLGLNVRIVNPYQFETKGQMLRNCKGQSVLRELSSSTVSCGKWKRKSQQCGRCLPCVIRRAAFAAAKIPDGTDYRFPDLTEIDDPADLVAIRQAYLSMKDNPEKWIRRAGPLPADPTVRKALADVFVNGLKEVDCYITNALQ